MPSLRQAAGPCTASHGYLTCQTKLIVDAAKCSFTPMQPIYTCLLRLKALKTFIGFRGGALFSLTTKCIGGRVNRPEMSNSANQDIASWSVELLNTETWLPTHYVCWPWRVLGNASTHNWNPVCSIYNYGHDLNGNCLLASVIVLNPLCSFYFLLASFSTWDEPWTTRNLSSRRSLPRWKQWIVKRRRQHPRRVRLLHGCPVILCSVSRYAIHQPPIRSFLPTSAVTFPSTNCGLWYL